MLISSSEKNAEEVLLMLLLIIVITSGATITFTFPFFSLIEYYFCATIFFKISFFKGRFGEAFSISRDMHQLG